MTVSESGEGSSWILLLLLLRAEVSTIETSDMSRILSSMFLHTGVSAIGAGDDREGEYCIEFAIPNSLLNLHY